MARFHVSEPFSDKHKEVKVPSHEFDDHGHGKASAEDVARHVVGRMKGGKGYAAHGTINIHDDGSNDGSISGTHTYEGKTTHFRIKDLGD